MTVWRVRHRSTAARGPFVEGISCGFRVLRTLHKPFFICRPAQSCLESDLVEPLAQKRWRAVPVAARNGLVSWPNS
jgi:hypothetical protein